MNPFLEMMRPVASNFNNFEQPPSFGSCVDGAPFPCMCNNGRDNPSVDHAQAEGKCDDVAVIGNADMLGAKVRFVGGLNTINVTEFRISEALPGPKPGVIFSFAGTFANLPMDIRFQTPIRKWGGTNACCGENVHFAIKLNYTCNVGQRGSITDPYFSSVDVYSVDLDNIVLKQGGIPLMSVTKQMQEKIKISLRDLLKKKDVFEFNDRKLTVLEAANIAVKLYTGGQPLSCQ